jgi:hypothetical protein
MLSFVAMIGATPLESRDDPAPYVPLTSARAGGSSDPIENTSPAHPALSILRSRIARRSAPRLPTTISRSAPGSAPATQRL